MADTRDEQGQDCMGEIMKVVSGARVLFLDAIANYNGSSLTMNAILSHVYIPLVEIRSSLGEISFYRHHFWGDPCFASCSLQVGGEQWSVSSRSRLGEGSVSEWDVTQFISESVLDGAVTQGVTTSKVFVAIRMATRCGCSSTLRPARLWRSWQP